MIRPARPGDVPEVMALAVKAAELHPLPVEVDQKRIMDAIRTCMAPNSFLWVSEMDGKVVGAVAAATMPSFWFKRQTCTVLMYYTDVPGEGGKLLHALADWVKSRSAIKLAAIDFLPGADPRLIEYMKRQGFSEENVSLSYVRGL